MKDVPRHEQLFVLMDANARTGRREKGGVGSKDNKILGAYGRDILNDNGELLLSFANNHDLAILNTFFSTSKGGVSHTFNGRGKKRIDYILTRQCDRKLVRNVTERYGALLPPERPSHTHTPKPGFGGRGHEMIVYYVMLLCQRIVLATEETTATLQVSHRPIK